jgi:hypothetical protein
VIQPADASGTQRRTTIVLAVLVTVLVAAAGLFLTLFLMEKSETGKVSDQLSVTEREIVGEQDRLADTRSTVDDLEAKGEDLQATNDYLQKCADASKETIRVAGAGSDEELQAAIDQMLIDCVRQEGT